MEAHRGVARRSAQPAPRQSCMLLPPSRCGPGGPSRCCRPFRRHNLRVSRRTTCQVAWPACLTEGVSERLTGPACLADLAKGGRGGGRRGRIQPHTRTPTQTMTQREACEAAAALLRTAAGLRRPSFVPLQATCSNSRSPPRPGVRSQARIPGRLQTPA